MILYSVSRDNGAEEPWNHEVEWTFEITFNWRAFLLGFSAYGGVYTINAGPFAFIFFYNWDLR